MFKENEWKSKKKALATWINENRSTSSNESIDGNLCLMAQLKDLDLTAQNFDCLNDDFSFEELQDDFDDLAHDFKKLIWNLLKKKIMSLENKANSLKMRRKLWKLKMMNFKRKTNV